MSTPVVPVTVDNVLIAGLAELQAHLQEITNDPSTAFNPILFDHVQLQLTEDNIPALLPTLLPSLVSILRTTSQDPTPLIHLVIELLGPLSFTRALEIAEEDSIATALRSPLPGANLLALAILHKAAKSPADTAELANLCEIVEELIKRWLNTEDVGVGNRAGQVLADLLATDSAEYVETGANFITDVGGPNGVNNNQFVMRRVPGQADLWNLVFGTAGVLGIIISHCNLNDQTLSRTDRQISLSQGRLLDLLTRLTHDFRWLTTTYWDNMFPVSEDVLHHCGQGILQWAALEMVDRADILMHRNLIEFFETFVSIMRVSARSGEPESSTFRSIVHWAIQDDPALETALRTLPDRTIESEAELLRVYINTLLP